MTPPRGAAVRERDQALAERRAHVARSLGQRFWLRTHGSLIVAATFSSGFLVNYALLSAGLDAVLPRWLLAVLAGYVAFFVFVRLWLAYVGIRAVHVDGVDVPSSGGSGGSPGGTSLDVPFRGGGGRFGGGGATTDFAPGGSARPILDASRVSTGSGKSTMGVDLDVGDGILVVVLVAIAVAIAVVLLGSAVHLVWIAPELLADAAFAAMLATGAIPGLRRIGEPDWSRHVLRATWKHLVAIAIVAAGAALALMHWFPGARTLGDAVRRLA